MKSFYIPENRTKEYWDRVVPDPFVHKKILMKEYVKPIVLIPLVCMIVSTIGAFLLANDGPFFDWYIFRLLLLLGVFLGIIFFIYFFVYYILILLRRFYKDRDHKEYISSDVNIYYIAAEFDPERHDKDLIGTLYPQEMVVYRVNLYCKKEDGVKYIKIRSVGSDEKYMLMLDYLFGIPQSQQRETFSQMTTALVRSIFLIPEKSKKDASCLLRITYSKYGKVLARIDMVPFEDYPLGFKERLEYINTLF